MAQSLGGLWLVYVVVHVVTLVTQAGIGYWVYRNQWDRNGARWFLITVATGMVWVGGFLLFFLPVGTALREAAFLIGVVGAVATIGAFIVFISAYTETGLHRNPLIKVTLLGVTGVCAALAATNWSHGLLYTFTTVSEPFPHVAAERQPLFEGLLTLVRLPAFYATYLMVRHLLATRRRSRVQLLLFVVGVVVITALDFVSEYTALMPLDGVTHATFGMLVFYGFTALALFRFSLLDVRPVARNTIIETLTDPVLVLDERQYVVDYNEAARDIWAGIGDDGPNPFRTVCPTLAEVVGDVSGRAAEPVTDRLPLSVDGEQRYYSVTLSAVDRTGGADTGWHAVLLRDVTELERSRWQLATQNERLDQVASTISHDLRNPINVATGQVELIEADLRNADVDSAVAAGLRERTAAISNATGRMEDIIEDILTIAREGKTVEATDTISLESVAEEAWGNVDTGAATLSVAGDPTVDAEHSKLLSILENLFRNAVDHGPADVTVEVSTTEHGFAVADDGPGIPEEHRDSVFEYGYTTSQSGTGLGLSIVETMAEAHGWTVDLSDDADGTRFVFRTTVGDGEETATTDPTDAPGESRTARD